MYEAHVTVDVEESLNERLENLASREGLTLHKFTTPKLNGQGYFVETMLSSRLFSPLHIETLLRREFRSDSIVKRSKEETCLLTPTPSVMYLEGHLIVKKEQFLQIMEVNGELIETHEIFSQVYPSWKADTDGREIHLTFYGNEPRGYNVPTYSIAAFRRSYREIISILRYYGVDLLSIRAEKVVRDTSPCYTLGAWLNLKEIFDRGVWEQ